MCAVSLTVRPNVLGQYESPAKIFRQQRTQRLKPVSRIGSLRAPLAVEIKDMKSGQLSDVAFEKNLAYVCINYPEQAGSGQGSEAILAALSQDGIPLTMVSVQSGEVSFALERSWRQALTGCLRQFNLYPQMLTNCTKCTIRENSGQPFPVVMALLEAAAANQIPVLRLSETYGLIEFLTEDRYFGQLKQVIAAGLGDK